MMKQVITIFTLIITHFTGFSQIVGARVYKLGENSLLTIGASDDSTTNFLVLSDDSSFYFRNHSSGSCFLWFDAEGKWSLLKDTVTFEWKDQVLNPYSTVLITRYIINSDILFYSDSSETNIVRNWGEFKLQKLIPDLKKEKNDNYIKAWVCCRNAYKKYLTANKNKFNSIDKTQAYRLLFLRSLMSADKILADKTFDFFSEKDTKDILSFYDAEL